MKRYFFSGGILQEVGLSPPLHQLQLTTSPDIADVKISLESINLLDANVLFVMLNAENQLRNRTLLLNKLNTSSMEQLLSKELKIQPMGCLWACDRAGVVTIFVN